MEDSASTLVWHRVGPNWSIDLHERPENQGDRHTIFLTGRSENLWRSRHMAARVFKEIARYADYMWDHGSTHLPALRKDISEIPRYPNTLLIGKARCGPCAMHLLVHRESDDVVPTLALYDAEDENAPVLYAIGRDIDHFVQDLADACSAIEKRTVA